MRLKIAFSTCPNDTFIFDAFIHHKIKDCPYQFDVYLADIEELNDLAFRKEFDIIKLSFHALGFLQKDYVLLDSGSALGRGCGPLVISKKYKELEELENKTVALPGKYTTANFLFDFALNKTIVKKNFVRFDKIIPQIISGEVDAGVIIHESRFTYKDFQVNSIIDLGENWERKTGLPIPLGGVAAKKDLGLENIRNIDLFLKQSINFAKENFNLVSPFIKKYAQELNEEVIKSHINLYVNDFTYSLGKEGREAVNFFISTGFQKKIFPENRLEII